MLLKKKQLYICLNAILLLFGTTTLFLYLGQQAVNQQRQISWPEHYRISCNPNITGKGIEGECLAYAINVRTKLVMQANIWPEMLVFNWWNDQTGEKGTHAMVYYKDQHGYYWVVDNQMEKPIQVYPVNKLEDLIRPTTKDTLRYEALPTLLQQTPSIM